MALSIEGLTQRTVLHSLYVDAVAEEDFGSPLRIDSTLLRSGKILKKTFLMDQILECSSKGLILGIDPGRRMSGLVAMLFWPAMGVVKAERLYNSQVCDLVWEAEIYKVCMEDYRLYPWLLGSLKWNELKEVRLIGAVEEVCRVRHIPLVLVSPSQSKALVKDHDLVALGTWSRNVHVNDAFRVFWATILGGLDGE